MIKSYIVLFQTISILPPIEGIGISLGGRRFSKTKEFKEHNVCV